MALQARSNELNQVQAQIATLEQQRQTLLDQYGRTPPGGYQNTIRRINELRDRANELRRLIGDSNFRLTWIADRFRDLVRLGRFDNLQGLIDQLRDSSSYRQFDGLVRRLQSAQASIQSEIERIDERIVSRQRGGGGSGSGTPPSTSGGGASGGVSGSGSPPTGGRGGPASGGLGRGAASGTPSARTLVGARQFLGRVLQSGLTILDAISLGDFLSGRSATYSVGFLVMRRGLQGISEGQRVFIDPLPLSGLERREGTAHYDLNGRPYIDWDDTDIIDYDYEGSGGGSA